MSDNNSPSQKEDNNPDIIEQATKKSQDWVEAFLFPLAKPLIRFAPLGGSGFIFVDLLLKQEWFIAFITFPVTIVSVIWAAYSKSVLTRFSEIYAERGTKDVDSLMKWVDKTDKAIKETIKWQLAKPEEKYLKCQGNACVYYSTEGTSSIFKPLLKDVFVPLELSGEFIRDVTGENIPNPRGYQWDEQLVKLMSQNKGLTIWDVFKRIPKNPAYRTLAILAWGGYGKTTLLRHITYTYAQKKLLKGVPKLLPVLLLLRKWQTLIAEEKPDLVTLIESHHIPSLPQGKEFKRPANWAKNLLNSNKMLIMFDGFDEVREEWQEEVSKWIAQAMKNNPYAYFILTSRPAGYKNYKAENKPNTTLRLKAFNDDQRARFIKQWYLARERHISAEPDNPVVTQTAEQKSANLVQQLKEREELNDLAKNPLLLNMIVNLHSVAPTDTSDLSRNIQLPQRRSQLYREIFRLQLGDRPTVKNIEMCLDALEAQQVLQKLALSMVQKNKSEIEYDLLMDKLAEVIRDIDNSVDVKKFIQQMVDVSELLVKKDENYEFAHLSFQGYLAGKEILDTKQENLLINNWDKAWWKETILLYSAQINPNNLLRQLINIGTKEAITLALRCIDETPRKIDAEVTEDLTKFEELEEQAKQVSNLLFQDLEEYLKNKQWKEADKETDRLMLQLGDKDEKGYLDYDDCRNFPKEELRIIDRLWLEYSDNHFGLSVQKQIYLDCGGKLDQPDDQAYQKMSNLIGWRRQNDWLSYSEYTFNTNAPKGHLPNWGCGWWVGGRFWVGWGGDISLFSSLNSNT